MNYTRTIFLILSKDIIRRNIYDTNFWGIFCDKTSEVQKVLIVPAGQIEMLKSRFAQDGVIIEGYSKVPWKGWDKVVMFLVRTGLCSHSTKVFRWRAYESGATGIVGTLSKEFIANTLGRWGLYKKIVRVMAGRISVSTELKGLFDRYQPTAVFAPSLIDLDFDVPISVAARRENIPVIGMVRSWDNLNNHGLMPFYPDKFIVQNKWLQEATQVFQNIPTNKLPTEVVGLPHYDNYKHPEALLKSRDDFFVAFGLDPKKKLILLGGSDFYYSEDTLPKKINDAISNNIISASTQLVFRPHPKSLFDIKDYRLESLPHVVLDDAFSGKAQFSDAEKFINLVYHADIIINIASTLSIDAAVFDTPVICISFDDHEKNLSKYERVDRLYDSFDHYERLVETGGVSVAKTEDELYTFINMYLENPSEHAAGRQRILDEFVEPFDGKSGQRLAELVALYVEGYVKK